MRTILLWSTLLLTAAIGGSVALVGGWSIMFGKARLAMNKPKEVAAWHPYQEEPAHFKNEPDHVKPVGPENRAYSNYYRPAIGNEAAPSKVYYNIPPEPPADWVMADTESVSNAMRFGTLPPGYMVAKDAAGRMAPFFNGATVESNGMIRTNEFQVLVACWAHWKIIGQSHQN